MKQLARFVFESKRISRNMQERCDYVQQELAKLKPSVTKSIPVKPKKPSGYISRVRQKSDPRFIKLGMFQRKIMDYLRNGYRIEHIEDDADGFSNIVVTDGDNDTETLNKYDLKALIKRGLLIKKKQKQKTTSISLTVYKFAELKN